MKLQEHMPAQMVVKELTWTEDFLRAEKFITYKGSLLS